ncbi:hypothetical protein ACF09Z_21745 [Streptomyces erythrochromogenes]|uniref:hypothetical protein n=1 Tax=Streptomyces erythrochromogenes TaxID=285574 RepID=UPI0037011A32
MTTRTHGGTTGCRFLGRIEGHTDGGDHVGFLLAPVGTSRPGPERPPLLLLLSDVLDLTPGHPA